MVSTVLRYSKSEIIISQVFNKRRHLIMSEGLVFTSYMFAALSGICFVKGIVVLSGGRKSKYGKS